MEKDILEKFQKISIYSYIASPRADRPMIILLTNFEWNQFKIFLLELKYFTYIKAIEENDF